MTEDNQNKDVREDIILIAEVRAYLLNGDTIELLPFKNDSDVRAEITKFIEDWSRTGFLLKGSFLYPWYQVKTVEVLSVEAMTHAEAQPYLDIWRQDSEAQQDFWKTRKPEKKEEKKEEK